MDTNIWHYLVYPQDAKINPKILNAYSDFFDQILRRDCLIETNLLQISEVINLIVQSEYKEYRNSNRLPKSLKDYKAGEEGKIALKNAKTFTQTILSSATIVSGIFNEAEMKSMAVDCDKADFNDLFFARMCQKNNCTIVTHDFDFKRPKL